jgi:hypothetical protein
MAAFVVLQQEAPYSTIAVEFGGQSFEQCVVVVDPDALQAYAEEYEAAWNELMAG